MGKVARFNISLDQSDGEFDAGQTVEGRLELGLDKPMKMRGEYIFTNFAW